MVFSLILGILIGAVAVIFALQNVAVITVSFFAWQITAPLALILVGSLAIGAVTALLMLIPSTLRDDAYLAALKREKRELEDEIARLRRKQEEAEAEQARTQRFALPT